MDSRDYLRCTRKSEGEQLRDTQLGRADEWLKVTPKDKLNLFRECSIRFIYLKGLEKSFERNNCFLRQTRASLILEIETVVRFRGP